MHDIDSSQSAVARSVARDAEIEDTVARVRPIVVQILARACRVNRLRPDDADEVHAAAMLRIVRRLQTDDIDDVDAYVATLTRNALHDLIRARYPQRARLKKRLRLLLGDEARFAVWTDAGVTVCGLTAWKGRPPLTGASPAAVSPRPWNDRDPAGALERVLEQLGGPVELDELVSLLMQAWQIAESAQADVDPATFVASLPSQFERFERREYLERLWHEIVELPPMQRTALLLNLRDHQAGNALLLFLILEIATFDEIAAATGVGADELPSLWNELPLDDLAIAARLGMTRQKVINLRKSARERLARRVPR